jgi:hypothetical protein
MSLRLVVRAAGPQVMQNIMTLQKEVTVSGTVDNPKFHGHPLTLSNLQYWLSFADWALANNSNEFSRGRIVNITKQAEPLLPGMTQEDVVKSILTYYNQGI